ncbi:hypothetical protein MMC34_004659 [Xylographa carneopallida]|nr:hypothetical protein [Xylographa carneopallida]
MDPLPPDAIQRVLFLSPSVHVYAIPPLTSTKGYLAASWTSPSVHQFPPCRLRIVETAIPTTKPSSSSTNNPPTPFSTTTTQTLTTTLLLEDPTTGALFAACPYTSPASVSATLDSTRFFALRVVGEGGRRAVLGVGFEERAEAFDFGVVLQEVRKVLGMDGVVGGAEKGRRKAAGKENVGMQGEGEGARRDWSLKEGESIRVDVGGRGIGRERREGEGQGAGWIAPPSAGVGEGGGGEGGVGFLLPPPPSAKEVREERRRDAQEGGFDDGEFGEFQ